MKHTSWVAPLVIAVAVSARAQVVQAPFDTDYSFVDLGSAPGVPTNAGGLVFLLSDPDTLLIGGAANSQVGKIYSIGVTRGIGGHITAFNGTAAVYASAPGIGSGGIDGGLAFAPNGVLFYTSYPDNSIGQIKPGSSAPDSQIALSSLTPTPVASSVGALAFVPPGFAGAGRFKLVQYSGSGNWYDVTLTPNGGGTYDVTGVTFVRPIGLGPEGVIYVKAGSPQFSADSALISEYGGGSVGAYELDANGDPLPATRRAFITSLTGAEGAAIDPQTGDFFFSTFGGGNRVIAVRGFLPPPTTTSSTSTSTSSTAFTSTSTTSSVTTTDSTSTTSTTTITVTTATIPTTSSTSTSTPLPGSTSTTSTTLPGDCAAVPVGPTFASIRCRLDALVDDTTVSGPSLANLTDKLLNALDKAGTRLDAARSKCAVSDAKHARSDLKKLVRKFIQYSHRLRTQSARKKIAEEVREPLAETGDQLRDDTSELRDSLACPEDAS
jgi:hypothetical protein